MQSNPVNTDTEGAIESFRINGVSVFSRLNLENTWGLSFPGDKATCQNYAGVLNDLVAEQPFQSVAKRDERY